MASVSLATSLSYPEISHRRYGLGLDDKNVPRDNNGVCHNRCRGRRTPCHAVGDACMARTALVEKRGSPDIDAWSYEDKVEAASGALECTLWSYKVMLRLLMWLAISSSS